MDPACGGQRTYALSIIAPSERQRKGNYENRAVRFLRRKGVARAVSEHLSGISDRNHSSSVYASRMTSSARALASSTSGAWTSA